jgi:hypothetical protein
MTLWTRYTVGQCKPGDGYWLTGRVT